MLVYILTNISNMSPAFLNVGDWKLVPGPFMILIKLHNEICQFLVVDI